MDNSLVKSKMADIQEYLLELLPILNKNSRTIIENRSDLHTVERMFQLIVDTAIDLNTHIITAQNFAIPDDYFSSFTVLGENHILPMDFALKIAPSVGLRNLIVHKYGKVDLKRMVDDIKNEISDYKEYLVYIDKILGH